MEKHARVPVATFMAILLMALTACSQPSAPPKPADILPKLESAINKFDINAALDCYEPSVKKAFGGLMGLVGSAVGFGGSSVMDLLPFASQMAGQYASRELGDISVKLTEVNTVQNGNNATMQVRVTAAYQGQEKSEDITLKLVLVGGAWYLSAEDLQGALLDGLF